MPKRKPVNRKKLHRYSRIAIKEGSPLVIHDKKYGKYVLAKSGNRHIYYRVNHDDTLTMKKMPKWLKERLPKRVVKKPKKRLLTDAELLERYMKMGGSTNTGYTQYGGIVAPPIAPRAPMPIKFFPVRPYRPRLPPAFWRNKFMVNNGLVAPPY